MKIRTLNNWSIHVLLRNAGTPKETKYPLFKGILESGDFIALTIKGFDKTLDAFISNANMYFQLGETNPTYLKQFPHAKERLLGLLRDKYGDTK